VVSDLSLDESVAFDPLCVEVGPGRLV